MDYVVYLESGSSVFLEHSGVKGMKWGVRNAETQKRYSRQRKQKVERVAKSTMKDLKGAALAGAGTAAATTLTTGSMLVGATAGGAKFAAMSGYSLAANTAAVARGKKTFQERVASDKGEILGDKKPKSPKFKDAQRRKLANLANRK